MPITCSFNRNSCENTMRPVLALLTASILFGETALAQYTGTGSVTQGVGTVTTKDLYVCPKGRPTNLGTIASTDGRSWTLPAAVSYANGDYPQTHDLHNACTGVTHASTAAARTALANSSIVTVDADGEVITGYVFADNYFEMYVNGKPVGKDNVPYTQFNSSVVKFRAKRPCTIAILAVDWEENLGLGTEVQGTATYHAGDAGIVIAFTDQANNIIATTSSEWKAQTFYISPVQDLSCLDEVGSTRSSNQCSTADAVDGSKHYGVHWVRPANWMLPDYDDSSWPVALEFSNQEVGVDNKPAYTNFTDVFDAPSDDATFIWTSNLVLDNEVLLRYRIPGTTSVPAPGTEENTESRRYELYTLNGVLVASSETLEALKVIQSSVPVGPYIRIEWSSHSIHSSIVLVY